MHGMPSLGPMQRDLLATGMARMIADTADNRRLSSRRSYIFEQNDRAPGMLERDRADSRPDLGRRRLGQIDDQVQHADLRNLGLRVIHLAPQTTQRTLNRL